MNQPTNQKLLTPCTEALDVRYDPWRFRAGHEDYPSAPCSGEKPNPSLFFVKNPPPNGSVSATHNVLEIGWKQMCITNKQKTHTLKKETNHLYLNRSCTHTKVATTGSGESPMDGWWIWWPFKPQYCWWFQTSGKLTSWYDKYPIYFFLGFQHHPNGGWLWDISGCHPTVTYCPGFTKISQLLVAMFFCLSRSRYSWKLRWDMEYFWWRRFAKWNFSEPQDFGVNKIFQTIIYFRRSSHKRKLVESRWECWKRFGISLVGTSWKGKHLQTRLYISYIKSKKNTRVA